MTPPSEKRDPKPRFFTTPTKFRAWLEANHDRRTEQWVGFHKKASGRPTITHAEAVEQALCFGWIDGLTKTLDEDSYMIRFSPRRARSNWSAINVRTVERLKAEGLMRPAGLSTFEARGDERTGVYSYEQRGQARLDAEQERRFRANRKAWEYFNSRPPGYRQTAIWWVVSAKREATRRRRLEQLIDHSAQGRPIPPLR